jgi:hypothetical protein
VNKSPYPILDRMQRLGLPLNRETYLTLDRWELNPKLGPEEEAALPPQFREDFDGKGVRWCRWCGAMVVPEIAHGVRTDDWIHIEDVGEPGGESECSFEQPLYRERK